MRNRGVRQEGKRRQVKGDGGGQDNFFSLLGTSTHYSVITLAGDCQCPVITPCSVIISGLIRYA
jgi:hypothetical protein